MPVTRRQIIRRGLSGHCPNCGGHTLFPPGAHFTIHERCANCGLKFNRGEGFFLGPFVINGTMTAIIAAGTGAFVLPLLLYRRSWSWWLLAYFFFLPQKLPQNHDALRED